MLKRKFHPSKDAKSDIFHNHSPTHLASSIYGKICSFQYPADERHEDLRYRTLYTSVWSICNNLNNIHSLCTCENCFEQTTMPSIGEEEITSQAISEKDLRQRDFLCFPIWREQCRQSSTEETPSMRRIRQAKQKTTPYINVRLCFRIRRFRARYHQARKPLLSKIARQARPRTVRHAHRQ